MKRVVVYDKATEEIKRIVTCSNTAFDIQCKDDTEGWFEVNIDAQVDNRNHRVKVSERKVVDKSKDEKRAYQIRREQRKLRLIGQRSGV